MWLMLLNLIISLFFFCVYPSQSNLDTKDSSKQMALVTPQFVSKDLPPTLSF